MSTSVTFHLFVIVFQIYYLMVNPQHVFQTDTKFLLAGLSPYTLYVTADCFLMLPFSASEPNLLPSAGVKPQWNSPGCSSVL